MAGGKRKRQQRQHTDAPSKAARTEMNKADEKAVDRELKRVNDLLQSEETSQKQTWQIGKRLKQLMETYPHMATHKTIDAFFLWGTALARLASLNDDPTLAEAAADKFQEMHTLSHGDDAAMGPVGYSLWASSLLIVATETRQRDVLDDALSKFAQAVEVDGGTTFETRFQFAKALKEGGDLVKFLQTDDDAAAATSYKSYYKRALDVCGTLEQIYDRESKATAAPSSANDSAATAATNDASSDSEVDNDDDDNDDDDNDDDDNDDDDTVLVEDFAEVKLLQAVLHGAIEDDASTRASFDATRALFQQALAISPGSPDALMELASYVGKTRLQHRPSLKRVDWCAVVDDLEALYSAALLDAGFALAECHAICERKDTQQQDEPDDADAIDERVPHLLHALGKALAAFAMADAMGLDPSIAADSKQKQKQKQKPLSRFVHAVEVLRAAHHFHDKLGCYPLAVLYAARGIEDEENCRTWLETAESYGVLDDELQLDDLATMHDKDWFAKFLSPVEALDDDAIHGDANEVEAEDDDSDISDE